MKHTSESCFIQSNDIAAWANGYSFSLSIEQLTSLFRLESFNWIPKLLAKHLFIHVLLITLFDVVP